MIRVAVTPRGAVFHVRARPGGSRRRAGGEHDGSLKVETTAAPDKGKANSDLIEILAAALGLRKSQLEIVAGAKGRDKQVAASGVDAVELERRLNDLAGR